MKPDQKDVERFLKDFQRIQENYQCALNCSCALIVCMSTNFEDPKQVPEKDILALSSNAAQRQAENVDYIVTSVKVLHDVILKYYPGCTDNQGIAILRELQEYICDPEFTLCDVWDLAHTIDHIMQSSAGAMVH